ncbi:TRAP transporter small permease [Hoeflea sp.]|uniref:TRAP transporter small permease n=1 Tax=Hoeflea sp. TaxID=1940281 RepID=UPI0025BF531C|nr:TRAP transporter small permease [Hoeflea sp.]
MRRLDKWISRIAESVSALSMLAVAMLIIHIAIDVIMRAVLNIPLGGTIMVVSLYYMPLVVFLPLAFTETRSAHISVELLYDIMPNWLKQASDVLAHLLSVTVFILLAVRCWGEAMAKYGINSAEMEGSLRLATWPSYFILPVGYALIVAVVVYRIACLLRRHEPDFDGTSGHDVVEEAHGV